MGDWLEIGLEVGKALGTGIGAAMPVIGVLQFLHWKRGERFDRIDKSHEELAKKVDRVETDFDGLVRQLGGIVTDVERRFLTREEHVQAINRLDGSMGELNRTIHILNGHLFDIARERAT